jgi:hypothetical protein
MLRCSSPTGLDGKTIPIVFYRRGGSICLDIPFYRTVREVQFWALGFSRNRRKGSAVKNLAGELKTETVRYKLPVAREVNMENPGLDGLPSQHNFPENAVPYGVIFLHQIFTISLGGERFLLQPSC